MTDPTSGTPPGGSPESSADLPLVTVVGAGITGLTAAYRLGVEATRRAEGGRGRPFRVILVDSAPRVGGKLLTSDFMGRPVDEGADAFLRRQPAALDLVGDLGLDSQLVSPAQNVALVARGKRRRRYDLRRFPEGHVLGVPVSVRSLAASRTLRFGSLVRVALDRVLADNWPGKQESVGALVRRRLGNGAADGLVAPLVGGINAGRIDELDAEAVAPVLAQLAREGGSLMRAAARYRQQLDQEAGAASEAGTATASAMPKADGAAETHAAGVESGLESGVEPEDLSADSAPTEPQPVFAGLKGGMGLLVEALKVQLAAMAPTVEVRRNSRVTSIGRSQRVPLGFDVEHDGRRLSSMAVVLAVPAGVASRLCGADLPQVSTQLYDQPYASVSIVTLGYEASHIQHPLDAAGLLVPEKLGLLTTACSFGSSKWPHWADPGKVVLRVSLGRSGDNRPWQMDDDQLAAHAAEDARALLGLTGEPLAWRVSRWPGGLPQYPVGHTQRMEQLMAMVNDEYLGLFLAGAAYGGVGIPSCIKAGNDAAAAAIQHVTSSLPPVP